MSMHLPMRPGWTCQAWGLAWPCPSRQRQLLAEYARYPARARRRSFINNSRCIGSVGLGSNLASRR